MAPTASTHPRLKSCGARVALQAAYSDFDPDDEFVEVNERVRETAEVAEDMKGKIERVREGNKSLDLLLEHIELIKEVERLQGTNTV